PPVIGGVPATSTASSSTPPTRRRSARSACSARRSAGSGAVTRWATAWWRWCSSAAMSAMATPGTEDIRPTEAELPARLEPVIHRRLPDTAGTRIANWRAAERGMSTETFLFDLQRDGPDGPVTVRRLVFRRPPAVSLFPDYDLLRQVLVMNRLRDTEVPVPTVCWLDRDGMELGTPYYVMEQIPTIGSPGDFPSYHCAGMYFDATSQQRTTMWTGCVRAMADVHTLD